MNTYDQMRAAADLIDRMCVGFAGHPELVKQLMDTADRLEALEKEMRDCEWKHAIGWADTLRGEVK